ncbi:unnamed protein product [Callosobruchus maculatus]|uniref:Uncharacterized protein n=1 Tax=Callosobruchus maculatus TaxID=64391 RepID=A0A653CEE0_CALMS|nr:unnamed protein product [Callosobruchus maculatus]
MEGLTVIEDNFIIYSLFIERRYGLHRIRQILQFWRMCQAASTIFKDQ